MPGGVNHRGSAAGYHRRRRAASCPSRRRWSCGAGTAGETTPSRSRLPAGTDAFLEREIGAGGPRPGRVVRDRRRERARRAEPAPHRLVADRPGGPPPARPWPVAPRLGRAPLRPPRLGARRRRPSDRPTRTSASCCAGRPRRARPSCRTAAARPWSATSRGRPVSGPTVTVALDRLASVVRRGPGGRPRDVRRRHRRPGPRGRARGARIDARPLPAVVRVLDARRLDRDPLVGPAVARLRTDRGPVRRRPPRDAARARSSCRPSPPRPPARTFARSSWARRAASGS